MASSSGEAAAKTVVAKFTDENKYPPLLRLLYEWLGNAKTMRALDTPPGSYPEDKCVEWMEGCMRRLCKDFDPTKHSVAQCYLRTHRTSVFALGFIACLDTLLNSEAGRAEARRCLTTADVCYPLMCLGLLVNSPDIFPAKRNQVVLCERDSPCNLRLVSVGGKRNIEFFGIDPDNGRGIVTLPNRVSALFVEPQLLGQPPMVWYPVDSLKEESQRGSDGKKRKRGPEKDADYMDDELSDEEAGEAGGGGSSRQARVRVAASEAVVSPSRGVVKSPAGKSYNFLFVKKKSSVGLTPMPPPVALEAPEAPEAEDEAPEAPEAEDEAPEAPEAPGAPEAPVDAAIPVTSVDAGIPAAAAVEPAAVETATAAVVRNVMTAEAFGKDLERRMRCLERKSPGEYKKLLASLFLSRVSQPSPAKVEKPAVLTKDIAVTLRVQFALNEFKQLIGSPGFNGVPVPVYKFRIVDGAPVIPVVISKLWDSITGMTKPLMAQIIDHLQDGLLVYLFLKKLSKLNKMRYGVSNIHFRIEKALSQMIFVKALWVRFGSDFLLSGGYFDTGNRVFQKLELTLGAQKKGEFPKLFEKYEKAVQTNMTHGHVPESLARRLAYNDAFRNQADYRAWTFEISKLSPIVQWFQRDQSVDPGPILETVGSLHVSRVYEEEESISCDENGLPDTDDVDGSDYQTTPEFLPAVTRLPA